jgi:hypothetical protein
LDNDILQILIKLNFKILKIRKMSVKSSTTSLDPKYDYLKEEFENLNAIALDSDED